MFIGVLLIIAKLFRKMLKTSELGHHFEIVVSNLYFCDENFENRIQPPTRRPLRSLFPGPEKLPKVPSTASSIGPGR